MAAQETQPLAFNGERITPLIPLNPILLDYFTPEDLIKNIRFQPINDANGEQVRVILDLPLAGMNDGNPPENYRLFKDYPLKPENALVAVPVLEVWPNFRTPGWQEYYAFYYDAEYGDDTFNINLPTAQEPETFEEGRGSFQLARLLEFPTYIECLNNSNDLQGLIFLPTPVTQNLRGKWHIGVDFGTSFTNIYVNRNSVIDSLPLENLHLKVTDVTDFKVDTLTELPKFLYEFNLAIKELGIRELKPLKGYNLSPDPEDNSKLWRKTTKELKSVLLKVKGNSENIRVEPPFILALKTLLKVLGKEWAGRS